VFNTLGPLTNPAGAQRQVLGVADPGLGDKMAEVLKLLGSQRSLVVHGEDGLDELTLGADTRVWEVHNGITHSYAVSPGELGLDMVPADRIKGGGPEENAQIMLELFRGESGPIRDVVLLNSAAVMIAGGKAEDLKEGMRLAEEAIDGGRALQKVEGLVELSRRIPE
jgi:anthranilate phosphoribosyltransferase